MTLICRARLVQGEAGSPADGRYTQAPVFASAHDRPEAEAQEEEIRLSTITRRNTRMLLELQARSASELHDRAQACAISYSNRTAQFVLVQDAGTYRGSTARHAGGGDEEGGG